MMMPLMAMVDANIQREELLPSEKAFAYKMKHGGYEKNSRSSDRSNSPTKCPEVIRTAESHCG